MPVSSSSSSKRKTTITADSDSDSDGNSDSSTSIPPLPATAAEEVLLQPPLLLTILGFCHVEECGRVSGVSKAIREAASTDILWRPLLEARWPHLPFDVLTAIAKDGTKAFYGSRVKELEHIHSGDQEEDEDELRRWLKGMYLEYLLTHHRHGTVLASALIPLGRSEAEDKKVLDLDVQQLAIHDEGIQEVDFKDYRLSLSLIRPTTSEAFCLGNCGRFKGERDEDAEIDIEQIRDESVTYYDIYGDCKDRDLAHFRMPPSFILKDGSKESKNPFEIAFRLRMDEMYIGEEMNVPQVTAGFSLTVPTGRKSKDGIPLYDYQYKGSDLRFWKYLWEFRHAWDRQAGLEWEDEEEDEEEKEEEDSDEED